MKKEIYKRTLDEAEYIIKTKKTIREISKIFNKSKSTIHKDLSERLKLIDDEKYNQVLEILNYHLRIRHINGGEATKKKYKNLK
mgnify:FL=1